MFVVRSPAGFSFSLAFMTTSNARCDRDGFHGAQGRMKATLLKAIARGVAALSLASAAVSSAPTLAQIAPAYSVSESVTGFFQSSPSSLPPTSLGFVFNVDQTGYQTNALGFYNLPQWTSPANTNLYVVKLWSFVDFGDEDTDYTEEASVVFDPANTASYTLEQDWYFQPLTSPVTLNVSTAETGYAIAACGNFSTSGNGLPFVGSPDSTGYTFNPPVSYVLPSVFSVVTSVPCPPPLLQGAPPPYTSNGFWNANLSIVPGPAPVMAAAVGYGMARRLRRRIQSTR
jgi:hypothetical protein